MQVVLNRSDAAHAPKTLAVSRWGRLFCTLPVLLFDHVSITLSSHRCRCAQFTQGWQCSLGVFSCAFMNALINYAAKHHLDCRKSVGLPS